MGMLKAIISEAFSADDPIDVARQYCHNYGIEYDERKGWLRAVDALGPVMQVSPQGEISIRTSSNGGHATFSEIDVRQLIRALAENEKIHE